MRLKKSLIIWLKSRKKYYLNVRHKITHIYNWNYTTTVHNTQYLSTPSFLSTLTWPLTFTTTHFTPSHTSPPGSRTRSCFDLQNGSDAWKLWGYFALTRLSQISACSFSHQNLPTRWWSRHRPCCFLGRRWHHLCCLETTRVCSWSTS